MDGPTSTPAQRWLARLSFVLAGLVIVILPVFAAPRLGTLGPPGCLVPKPPRVWARLRHLAGISERAPRSPH
jgi:hypothetical protein